MLEKNRELSDRCFDKGESQPQNNQANSQNKEPDLKKSYDFIYIKLYDFIYIKLQKI